MTQGSIAGWCRLIKFANLEDIYDRFEAVPECPEIINGKVCTKGMILTQHAVK